jgi:uncharacterized protein
MCRKLLRNLHSKTINNRAQRKKAEEFYVVGNTKQQKEAMAPYRILSLDGGGCRAIIESTVLSRLLKEYPDLLNDVDLFAGASAGAILALCFAAGFSNNETSEFYERDVKGVFKTTVLREFEVCKQRLDTPWHSLVSQDLHGSIGAKYGREMLNAMLTKQFGSMRLRDLKKKGIPIL